MKQVIQRFLKGINKRLSIERGDEPDRLYTLKNARLQSRGSTMDVSRIGGLTALEDTPTAYTTPLDMIVFDKAGINVILVASYDGVNVVIDEYTTDLGTSSYANIDSFAATEPSITETKFIILEDTVLLSPYNKQFSYIGGGWRVNDFISTTPTITASFSGGTQASGTITVSDTVTDTDAEYATFAINVIGNIGTDPSGGTYKITIDGDDSTNILVTFVDTVETIATAIKIAVEAGTTWSAEVVSNVVVCTAPTFGVAYNGITPVLSLVSGDDILDWDVSISSGGVNSGGIVGGTFVTFGSTSVYPSFFVTVPTFNGGDTSDTVASGINTALNLDINFTQYYTSSVLGSVVTIQAINVGTEYNRDIGVTPLSGITFVDNEITGGTVIGGSLKQETDYYYKVRYVYYDGHKTTTCYPTYLRTTTTSRKIGLSIVAVPDLDDPANYADIEIFRREEGGDWFLIDRVTPTGTPHAYVDNGSVERGLLDEQAYVWQDTFNTHEIVRDRYVRANTTYIDRMPTVTGTLTTTPVTNPAKNQDVLPPNSTIDIYAQERFTDGLTTFHKKIGDTIELGNTPNILEIDQAAASSNTKEIAYYAKVKRAVDNTSVLPFNSVEIYNSNVGSIADTDDKPTSPHIFFGFKYLVVYYKYVYDAYNATTNTYNFDYSNTTTQLFDEEWDSTVAPDLSIDNDYVILENTFTEVPTIDPIQMPAAGWFNGVVGDIDTLFPETIEKIITHVSNGTSFGQPLKYRRKFVAPNTISFVSAPDKIVYKYPCAVYELAYLDALKESVRQDKLKVKLTEISNSVSGLSSIRPNSDFINTEVKVVGIVDTSETNTEVTYGDENQEFLLPSKKNHIYLQLEAGSVYDDFDVVSANNNDVKSDYDGSVFPNYNYRYKFNLLNLEVVEGTNENFIVDSTTDLFGEEDYFVRTYYNNIGLQSTVGLDQDIDGLIYLGKEPNINDTLDTIPQNLGVQFDVVNNFYFYRLKPSNIYETLLLQTDLQTFTTDFPNQIVWSEPYTLGSNANGSRNFTFSNFLNIERTYGEIVALSYVGNELLVFCKRGVAKVNVGEVVTQQVGGQVVVDSSTLLNGYFFALRNLPNVKAKSIVKYENSLFFGDGIDVWQYEGGFKNISNGAIALSQSDNWIGGIDPYNKEYIVTDGTNTFAYSIELQQWFEYTYLTKAFTNVEDDLYSLSWDTNDYVLSKNNTTDNSFLGEPYTTTLEGVANDLAAPTDIKQFRKFIIEQAGVANTATATILRYISDYNSGTSGWVEKNLVVDVGNFDAAYRNGLYYIGVDSIGATVRNSDTKIFWRLTTTDSNWVLRLLALEVFLRRRR